MSLMGNSAQEQASHGDVDHGVGHVVSAWYRDRVRDGKGRVKRIAITALARKLLVALWRFVTQGLVPTGAALKPVKAG